MKYSESIYRTKRWKTKEVMVGKIGVGGNHPVRIQSMTTSSTHDVEKTVDQAMKLVDYGCEIVRVTVQGMREADACEEIKNRLIQKGYDVPLVADIHFFPPAAMKVVDFVDKVRVNPGNYVDKRASFKVISYDDVSYQKELDRLEEKFTPLVEKCKRLKKAMRIGTNHGSLSDRIMNRYGDTPQGMVESALEFTRVCRKNDYHDIIFSMKASNPQIMIQAYRLLVHEMMKLGWNYPLHLGVTEAGAGEDGRIKSAIGIGSLLLDGLGDTIRVSLTEDPWFEIDPCKRLVNLAKKQEGKGITPFKEHHRHIDTSIKRDVIFPKNTAFHRDGTVLVHAKKEDLLHPSFYSSLDCKGDFGKPKIQASSADAVFVEEVKSFEKVLTPLHETGIGILSFENSSYSTPIYSLNEINKTIISSPFVVMVTDQDEIDFSFLKEKNPSYLLLSPKENKVHFARKFFEDLQRHSLKIPVILYFSYEGEKEDLILQASMEMGSLLCDRLGEGIFLDTPFGIAFNRNLAFGLLQGARMRSFKTEFISCPSCGRTLFDLQEVSQKIRERTSHLPGVKIGIMGCIVNGPGEMADSDFGYVGSKPGKIDLYVGKQKVEAGIDEKEAVDRLIQLIKNHGRWVEANST